jgi:CheY-like chemotaxis protein
MDNHILESKRIFIVEDDLTNMAIFSVALKQGGALVIQDFWNTGTLDMMTRVMPIDIVILDLMLHHGVSGYQIFDQIKSTPRLAHIPVVIVSASDPEIETPRAQAKGFAGFIGKPISFQDFPGQIAACIQGEQIWATG